MPWWLDLLLLSAAVALWCSGNANADDVWSLFQKLLAAVALAVVLLGGRQIFLELGPRPGPVAAQCPQISVAEHQ